MATEHSPVARRKVEKEPSQRGSVETSSKTITPVEDAFGDC